MKLRSRCKLFCGTFVPPITRVENDGALATSGRAPSALAGTARSDAKTHHLSLLLLALLLAIMNLGCSGLVAADPLSNGQPSIATQPTSQTVTAGQTATFNVAATGRGPLNYQWPRNGVAISSGASAG